MAVRCALGIKPTMDKIIIILTGSELRHRYFRVALALSDGVKVIRTYCEGLEKSLSRTIEESTGSNEQRLRHLPARRSNWRNLAAGSAKPEKSR